MSKSPLDTDLGKIKRGYISRLKTVLSLSDISSIEGRLTRMMQELKRKERLYILDADTGKSDGIAIERCASFYRKTSDSIGGILALSPKDIVGLKADISAMIDRIGE